MEKINLWNLTRKKSRSCKQYIKDLRPPVDHGAMMRFEKIVLEASNLLEGNDILSAIGYVSPFKEPMIYEWVIEKKRK